MPHSERYKEIADAANKYLELYPYASRTTLATVIGTGRDTLNKVAKAGLIPKYPPPMSTKQAGALARRVGGWGKNFRLRGSPKYENSY